MTRSAFLACVCCLSIGVVMPGCKSVNYTVQSWMGNEKRDILKSRVEAAQGSQEKAAEQFQSTYDRLVALSGAETTEIDERFEAFRDAYDDAEGRADAVRDRVEGIKSVAEDLFEEMEEKLEEITDESLKAPRRQRIAEARQQYNQMIARMDESVASMDPVLETFRNYVLALEIDRDTAAIGALEGTANEIDAEVQELINDMRTSIAEADEFIRQMDQ